jgi:L-amino acid N-acyltransferase YncA
MSTTLPLGAEERLEARAADGTAEALLWWTHTPALPGKKIGAIGGFHATSAAATAEVLRRAGEQLRARRCTLAVGPMDGNTWRRYRFVTASGGEPPFLLEPANPPEWPLWWQEAGFTPLAEFYSAATGDLAARDARLQGVAARMAAAGVRIRPLDPACFEAELGRIHEVSLVSFQQNFLYTPLPREEFVAQYRAVQARIRPDLVLLAECAGRPVGYVFAIPDYTAVERGAPLDTVVVKTLAVLPTRAHAGLGALLLSEVQAAARRLGFTRAIHALMHAANRSRNLSAHYATTFRRYTLFARPRAP